MSNYKQMNSNTVKVKKIGSFPDQFNLPQSKASLMYMFKFQHKRVSYIVASSLDSYLFCFCPSNPLKETFYVRTNYPITSCIYIAYKMHLYCGDLLGNVYLFERFPEQPSVRYSIEESNMLDQIDDYVMGMYSEKDCVMTVHASQEVKSWKLTNNFLVSQKKPQISKRPFVLVPIQNQTFNFILAIENSSKPFALKNLEQFENKIEQQGTLVQQWTQITDLDYCKQNKQIITGYFNGHIVVYSISQSQGGFVCSEQIKFNIFSERIIRVRMMGDNIIVLTQQRFAQIRLSERQMISSKENTKIGLLQVSDDMLILGNTYDPLLIPETKFIAQPKYKILKMIE